MAFGGHTPIFTYDPASPPRWSAPSRSIMARTMQTARPVASIPEWVAMYQAALAAQMNGTGEGPAQAEGQAEGQAGRGARSRRIHSC